MHFDRWLPARTALLLLLAAAAAGVALPGCLPGERSNDPLPDVKTDATKADAGKTDAKTDAAPTDSAADAADDAADVETPQDSVTPADVPVLGCKANGDCGVLPTLPCHATPTCNTDSGLCESAFLNEGDPCNADLCVTGATCDAGGACVGGKALSCDDKNPCTLDLCGAGVCAHPFANASCSDGVQCTISDHCEQGACVGSALDCDDFNPCTTDGCNETGDASLGLLNLCKHTPFGYAKQVVACTGNDPADLPFCDYGKCGVVQDCDDKNPCTIDGPDPITGVCTNTFAGDTAACGSDPCAPGTCQLPDGNPVGLPTCVTKVKCDDGKPCTVDSCDPTTGECDATTVLDKGTPCQSPDPCIIDGQCDGKTQCKGTTPLACNDGNPCTDDSCTSFVGCVGTPNTADCTDGNGCTTQDVCAKGACSGDPTNCDDANACTIDACDPIDGCSHALVPDGTSCGNNSKCAQGICKAK